jgi:SulP family sulfate permease
MFSFRPRLLECLRDYSRPRLVSDVLAGLAVGIVALPLAIGLGIASGVSPGAGIFTAIIGGFIVSAFGGSRVQIGGPAGAFVGLVYAIIHDYGLPNLLLCTAMAGLLLFFLGAARLGTMIKFIPHPVTTGFTCGIAITIMLTQVKDFLGLDLGPVPAEFFERIEVLGRSMPTANLPTLGIGVLSVAMIAFWPPRWSRVLPGSVAAVVLGSLLVVLLKLPVATIQSRFGADAFPSGLPKFEMLTLDFSHFRQLFLPTIAIALLGGIESLLSAVVSDGMVDDRHDSNQELMAQGLANFVVPFFGGIPVTGVIARTATNVRSGAGSPVAGITHAFTLLLIVLLAAPLAKFIPLTVLGAVLLVVAFKMGDWAEFLVLHRHPRGDAIVFVVTFVLTVIFDLSIAVAVAMMLATGLFIKRVTETTQVTALDEKGAAGQGHEIAHDVPPGVLVYRVFGALLFGAADKLDSVIRRANSDARVVILHVGAVTAVDATALNALETLHEKLRHHKKHLVLSGAHTQPYALMARSGLLDRVGEENVTADLDSAVARARAIIDATPRGGSRPGWPTAQPIK